MYTHRDQKRHQWRILFACLVSFKIIFVDLFSTFWLFIQYSIDANQSKLATILKQSFYKFTHFFIVSLCSWPSNKMRACKSKLSYMKNWNSFRNCLVIFVHCRLHSIAINEYVIKSRYRMRALYKNKLRKCVRVLVYILYIIVHMWKSSRSLSISLSVCLSFFLFSRSIKHKCSVVSATWNVTFGKNTNYNIHNTRTHIYTHKHN